MLGRAILGLAMGCLIGLEVQDSMNDANLRFPAVFFRRIRDGLVGFFSESSQPGALLVDHKAAQISGWQVVKLFIFVLSLVAMVRMAWVADDAFIAFRAMDNFVHGHGLVSNVGVRAQAFTSPLWILLLSPFHRVIGDAYFTGIVVGFVMSAVVSGLLIFRVAEKARPMDAIAIGLMLPFSRGFAEFSTSGLENPLLHLLSILFLLSYFRFEANGRFAVRLFLLAGLLFLTRMDTILLTALPLIHYVVSVRGKKLWRFCSLGLVPVFIWEAYAIVYYGFPFPNTAYAKLNVLVPAGKLIMQGVGYLLDGVARDPLSIIVIVFTIVVALVSKNLRARLSMLGVLLYVAYVVNVGGDFMSGRFFTVCFVSSLVVLGALVLPSLPGRWSGAIAAVVGIIVLSAPYNPLRPVQEPCIVYEYGITDERGCYAEHTALQRNIHRDGKGWGYQRHDYYQAGVKKKEGDETVYRDNLIGLGGYAAGPRIHIVDPSALTDPLLARIPFSKGGWRIGHFYRDVPEGYIESLRTGENQIKSACVHEYYDKLYTVVSGPVFSLERFKTVVAMNFGVYQYLLMPGCDEESR